MKSQIWLANFDLSCMALRCQEPMALIGSGHLHRSIRGSMKVEGEGWRSVASYTSKYPAAEATVYAKGVKAYVATKDPNARGQVKEMTALRRLADQSKMFEEKSESATLGHGSPMYMLNNNDTCYDLVGNTHRASPLAGSSEPTGSKRIVDQFHKVELPDGMNFPKASDMTEAEARADDERHEGEVRRADAYWKKCADEKNWEAVKADMSVYRYSGADMPKDGQDPRRTDEYRQKVVDGLGFGKGATRKAGRRAGRKGGSACRPGARSTCRKGRDERDGGSAGGPGRARGGGRT